MRNSILLLILLMLFITGCTSDSVQPQQDPELIKRLNQVNEILDNIDIYKTGRFGSCLPFSAAAGDIIATETEAKFLIENSDIALPEMFKRLDSKKPSYGTMFEIRDTTKLDYDILFAYYIVFEKTKSAESIPYMAEHIASVSEKEVEYCGIYGGAFTCALRAAQHITSLKLVDENRTLFDQRKDIADKLRQWYEEYKKSNAKQKK